MEREKVAFYLDLLVVFRDEIQMQKELLETIVEDDDFANRRNDATEVLNAIVGKLSTFTVRTYKLIDSAKNHDN